MKAFQLAPGRGLSSLIVNDRASEQLASQEIRVRMEAAALNHRDLQILDGRYGLPDAMIVTPGSDGVGIVVEFGALVTRFSAGERVLPAFWPDWIDGPIMQAKTSTSFRAEVRGTLATELVADENAFARAPNFVDSRSCLSPVRRGYRLERPVRGRWPATGHDGAYSGHWRRVRMGITARTSVGPTRDRDVVERREASKGPRTRRAETINYRTAADWAAATRELTGGKGVDLVIEVGGSATIGQSIASVRQGGTVIVIGGVGGTSHGLVPGSLVGGAVRLQGITVGSRSMLEELARFVDLTGIKPLVGRTFPAGETIHAFEALIAAGHFGKIAIALDRCQWTS